MTIDVATVCTDADLFAEATESICRLALPAGSTDFETFRSAALVDVLAQLATRRPPVYDTDLADPTELRRAVVYRALERLFRNAITQGGDTWDVRSSAYRREYAAAIAGLTPTVSGGAIGTPFGIPIARR